MKRVLGGLLFLAVGVLGVVQPAAAQGIPAGTYLRSCNNAVIRGEELIATCRRADGVPQRTALRWADRCVTDIVNRNGILECRYAGGRPGFGRVLAEGFGPPAYVPPAVAAPVPAGCGWGFHWQPAHWNRFGRWVPGECRPNR